MSWFVLLFVALIGAGVAALIEGALKGMCPGWSPRRRVFTAALAGPAVLIAAPLCVLLALVTLSPRESMAGLAAAAMVGIALTAALAAWLGGLLMAFIMERKILP